MHYETLVSDTACFITLTYGENYDHKTGEYLYGKEPDHSPSGLFTLNPKHLTDFWKRLRKKVNQDYPGTKLRYYAVGEYGSKYARPHYHAILFNLPVNMMCRSMSLAKNIWQHGEVEIAQANVATMAYVAGYLNKESIVFENDDRYPEFSRMSNKLGISYLTDAVLNMHHDRAELSAMHPGGFRIPLPRYYKNIIWEPEELKEINHELELATQVDWETFANTDFRLIVERTKMKQYQHTRKLLETRKTF